MRSFWACNHGSAVIAPLSPHGDGTSREPSASALGDLRVTVRAFPPGQSPRTFHSSRSSCSVRLPVNTSQFQALAVRWLAPRHGLWLTTTPCPGTFLPGSARGTDEVLDGPFLRPEAARLSPPSSLPSMAGRLGGTLTFPRWRVRLRCTCAYKTLPLGGIVLVSRPKPVSWRPLLRLKLTVLRAKPPLRCMPWLSCEYTKPRH